MSDLLRSLTSENVHFVVLGVGRAFMNDCLSVRYLNDIRTIVAMAMGLSVSR